jgi:hypothetical protein
MQAEQFRPFTSAMSMDSDLQVFTTEAEFYGKLQTLVAVIQYAQQFN